MAGCALFMAGGTPDVLSGSVGVTGDPLLWLLLCTRGSARAGPALFSRLFRLPFAAGRSWELGKNSSARVWTPSTIFRSSLIAVFFALVHEALHNVTNSVLGGCIVLELLEAQSVRLQFLFIPFHYNTVVLHFLHGVRVLWAIHHEQEELVVEQLLAGWPLLGVHGETAGDDLLQALVLVEQRKIGFAAKSVEKTRRSLQRYCRACTGACRLQSHTKPRQSSIYRTCCCGPGLSG